MLNVIAARNGQAVGLEVTRPEVYPEGPDRDPQGRVDLAVANGVHDGDRVVHVVRKIPDVVGVVTRDDVGAENDEIIAFEGGLIQCCYKRARRVARVVGPGVAGERAREAPRGERVAGGEDNGDRQDDPVARQVDHATRENGQIVLLVVEQRLVRVERQRLAVIGPGRRPVPGLGRS
jgi:hypothetical protein